MKHLVPYILFLILLCTVSVLVGQGVKEAFQSAGTLVQLESTHVPTLEEVLDRQEWLRKRVRQDMWELSM